MLAGNRSELTEILEQASTLVEARLVELTKFSQDCPDELRNAMRHILLASGKRLRPAMVLMAADACGQRTNASLAAACAIEMVHTYSLVHDDLPAMDDDELRRGVAACHIKFGETTAILAGDALLTCAFETLSNCNDDTDVLIQCISQLSHAAGASNMVGGQIDDLAAEFSVGDVEQLKRIHRRKTGAMFRAAVKMGAISARATDQQVEALDQYACALGLAFQIVDDLLDLQGDTNQLGKQVGKDAEHGKLTYPALLGAEESSRLAGELIEQAVDSLRIFEGEAEPLAQLAQFVVDRHN